MEPLSAFSLACNILQIVEYGANVLGRAAEYQTAPNGALSEHDTLNDVMQSLKRLNEELGLLLPSAADSRKAAPHESRLIAANQECMRIADGLIALLGRLKVHQPSTLEGIRMGIKSLWYDGKVKAMKYDLSEARDNLSLAFLLFMQHSGTVRHSELLRSCEESETRIIDTFQSTYNSLSSEIRALTTQFSSTSITPVDDLLLDFKVSHHDLLAELSRKLDTIISRQETRDLIEQSSLSSTKNVTAQQRILDSLNFPQIDERKHKISNPHESTYEWVLDQQQSTQQFDDLLSWTRSREQGRQLYWIYGKPGSGKSTLMRYLLRKLDKNLHFDPWGNEKDILKVNYFFWAPGTSLQKSFNGLLRALLLQLFSNAPGIIPSFVTPNTWNRASSVSASNNDIRWDSAELIEVVTAVVETKLWYTFFLIDGLDEFEGTDQERGDFMNLIRNLASFQHVKLCVSSRPLNIFIDAFEMSPKLRLEDHTGRDICRYIDQELNTQRRFERLREYNPSLAQELIHLVLSRASGVFLWVRLVVYELVKALRDGDDIPQLLRRVEVIPKDLNSYFAQMMATIEPRHHKEASTILQLALHQEHEFIALHPLRLIDLMCIQNNDGGSVLRGASRTFTLELKDLHKIHFDLDSTVRRVNSRCLCLVECQYLEGATFSDFDVLPEDEARENTNAIMQVYDWQVSFLHRSFRDFLLFPSNQKKLHEYSGGSLDARVLLCDARLLQLEALVRSTFDRNLVIGLASYVISSIAVPVLRKTKYCETAATRLRLVLDHVVQNASDDEMDEGPWYIGMSLRSYHCDESTFLTVAINFGLSAYVHANLTKEVIQDKKGRPILDHILRGPFALDPSVTFGNQPPDLELICRALEFGADPNKVTDYGTPWVSFLVELDGGTNFGDYDNERPGQTAEVTLLKAVLLLMEHGADPFLPALMMSSKGELSDWPRSSWEEYARASAGDVDRMLVSAADYLALLRPRYVLASELLEDCIVLASKKFADKVTRTGFRK